MNSSIRLRRALTRSHSQAGFTAVELIITLALTSIVIGAMFSVFLVLYRTQTAWQARAQATSAGVTAEQTVTRDAREYQVVAPGGSFDHFLSLDNTPGGSFKIYYSIASCSGQTVLLRTVGSVGGCGSINSTAVHGVSKFQARCVAGGLLEVTLSVESAGPGSKAVDVTPAAQIMPRAGGC